MAILYFHSRKTLTKMKVKYLFLSLVIVYSNITKSQETFPTNGVKNNFEAIHAFTNAQIIVSPQQTIKKGTLLIQGDIILSVDYDSLTVLPEGAVIHEMNGKFIYPSFIDLNTSYGIKKAKRPAWKPNPQYKSNTGSGAGWNQAIRAEVNSKDLFNNNPEQSEQYRNCGFGAVLKHNNDGIARGTGLLASLADESENNTVLRSKASAHYSLNKGNSRQKYPNSLMGVIALLNQTYLDAEWYDQNGVKEYNRSLESWNQNQELPQFFEINDKLDVERIWKIGDEFEIDYIVVGNGDEYQRLDALQESGYPVVLPLNFPKAYDVTHPDAAAMLSLQKMKHWEMAPANPAILFDNDIFVSFTSSGLEKRSLFLNHIKKAISHGLSQQDALAALTTNPAQIVEASHLLGTLQKGKIANFLVCSQNIFEQGEILSNWVQGKQYVVKAQNTIDTRATYLTNNKDTLIIFGSKENPKSKLTADSTTIKMKFTQEHAHLNFNYDLDGIYSIHAIFNNGKLEGEVFLPNGNKEKWNAEKISAHQENTEQKSENDQDVEIGQLWFPNMAYGWENKAQAKNVLFKNATVWTNEDLGIAENIDVAISDGKIVAIEQNIDAEKLFGENNFQNIDASNKHLTSGIIDEHSHIAISKGVNEGSQASSAEVSIQNVVNSDDINIYRQLSGGVTTAQLLHGSANPIGGQSALIKFRWGSSPQEMLFEGADGFIKFALGENVKQSNWGDYERIRFPQTRMGVEQVFYDHFLKAKEYQNEWQEYNNLSSSERRKRIAPREDLEMNTLVEILNSKRFISCHSYVQSEINMLMHVGDSMGFTINTFTHILEGYKLADKMKKHQAGASTFSDWWAYKYEVNDAIPYNAAILDQMGVVTAINSDDAEMARRLNQEAAKTVKYGGLSQEEAWKTVTLNPAKLLHIDNRVGSIKVGKDADLVLWNNNPLSVYAKVEQTYVDGKCYFDIQEDKILQDRNNKERNRIIQKMLRAKENGVPTQEVEEEKQHLYHCNSIEGHDSDHNH
jgi:imidazolonepropionase-like amidohydrolase